MGFRTLLVHRKHLKWGRNGRLPGSIARAAARRDGRIAALGSSSESDAYRLVPPATLHSDVTALSAVRSDDAPFSTERTVVPPRARLSFPIGNPRAATPEPFAPSDLVVTWRKRVGDDAVSEHVRALLPLAIARHATSELDLELGVPEEPGRYEVTVARAGQAGAPLARTSVRVARAGPS